MKLPAFIFLLLSNFSCIAQSDSLLFHSFERILKNEGGIGYNDEVFVAINKYDLETLKLKDTTVINVVGRNFKIIVLKNPADKKDFYVLPIRVNKDNYIVFNIQNCNRPVDKTFTVSYSKSADNVFVLDDFEVAESTRKNSATEE